MFSLIRRRLFCFLSHKTLFILRKSNDRPFPKYVLNHVIGKTKYSRTVSNERPAVSRYHPGSPIELAEENIRSRLSEKVSMNNEDWDNMKMDLLTEWPLITEENFCSIVMNILLLLNKLDLAHSLMQYLEQSDVKPNFVTYLKYISLCGKNHRLVNEKLIFQTFEKIQTLIDKSPILDHKSVACIVEGLCGTHKWKESLNYLKKIPDKPHVEIYIPFVCAAIRNNNENLAWDILSNWLKGSELSNDRVIEEFLLVALELLESKPIEGDILIRKVFQYMGTKDIVISHNVAKLIEKYFVCHRSKWLVTHAKINRAGFCESCNRSLEFSELTEKEFNYLRTAFLERVVEKSDVFINSNVQEYNNYMQFIKQNKPFHVVIDGLNAAYTCQYGKSRKALAMHLMKVVKAFKRKKLLVLGRKHMKDWPSAPMRIVAERARLFYTDNISQEDPFVIYAALASGPHTLFLSGDLMRDHMSRLDDPKTIHLFKKWQQSRQIFLHTDEDNNLKFTEPVRHCIKVQGSADDGWHIPFDDKILLDPYEELNNWLCIQRDLS